MGFSEQQIFELFAGYAYEPLIVYSLVCFLMLISSFGFPAPEEITLLSTGLVCYMGSRPDLYPPPSPDAVAVNVYLAATICFFAVFLSDALVYALGRFFGVRILQLSFMKKRKQQLDKVQKWTAKYGQWAAGIFRFTPGLRFPGHFSCGMMGLNFSKFTLVDGSAALLSVPTQIFVIAIYGESILTYLKQFKTVVFSVLAIAAAYYLLRYIWEKKMRSA